MTEPNPVAAVEPAPPKRNTTTAAAMIAGATVVTLLAGFYGDPSGPLTGWLQWLVMFGSWIAVIVYTAPRWYLSGVERMTDALGAVSMYLVILVVVVGFVNVVLRYLGRFTEQRLVSNRFIETQWYLFGIIFLLGFAYVLKHQINVRVDFWFANWPKRRRAWIDVVGHVLALLPFSILGMWVNWGPVLRSFGRRPDGSWPEGIAVWRTWEQSPDPSGFPRAPIKGMILVGFALLLLQAVAEMIKLRAILTDREAYYGLVPEDTEQPLRIE